MERDRTWGGGIGGYNLEKRNGLFVLIWEGGGRQWLKEEMCKVLGKRIIQNNKRGMH